MNYMEKIIEIIESELSEPLPEGKVISSEDDLFDDLHLSSLDLIVIINDIETEFDISVNVEDLENVRTVADIEKRIGMYVNR